MELVEDHGFAKAWLLCNGHYLMTFPDFTVEEFSTKKEYQEYVRRMKKSLGIKIVKRKSKFRRLHDKEN